MNYSRLISKIDIESELDKRGINGKIIGNNFMICCPYHNERNPSFGIALDGDKKGRFQCFGCGQRGNFFHFIAFLDEVTFEEAIQKYDSNIVDEDTIKEMKTTFKSFLSKKNEQRKVKIIDDKILEYFPKPYGEFIEYLENRKLKSEIIKRFNIRCCDEDIEQYSLYWKDRIIIPLYDTKMRLISIVARHINDNSKENKVRKVKGGQRATILPGLEFINGKNIVLVEGEIDAIYLQQFGIPAVSLGTTKISDTQMDLLIKKKFDDVYIALDGDAYRLTFNGKNVLKELSKKLSSLFNIEIIKLPKEKDPNDLTAKEVKDIFRKFI